MNLSIKLSTKLRGKLWNFLLWAKVVEYLHKTVFAFIVTRMTSIHNPRYLSHHSYPITSQSPTHPIRRMSPPQETTIPIRHHRPALMPRTQDQKPATINGCSGILSSAETLMSSYLPSQAGNFFICNTSPTPHFSPFARCLTSSRFSIHEATHILYICSSDSLLPDISFHFFFAHEKITIIIIILILITRASRWQGESSRR